MVLFLWGYRDRRTEGSREEIESDCSSVTFIARNRLLFSVKCHFLIGGVLFVENSVRK